LKLNHIATGAEVGVSPLNNDIALSPPLGFWVKPSQSTDVLFVRINVNHNKLQLQRPKHSSVLRVKSGDKLVNYYGTCGLDPVLAPASPAFQ